MLDSALLIALLAATWFLYAPDLDDGFFTVDDPNYVLNNPQIKEVSARNIARILTRPYDANYSPVHLISYMLDYSLDGENSSAFHASSNLWAGVVAGLVYLLAVTLLGNRWFALVAGALFVAHPSHVEAVAWISSRKDLLATAFALPATIAYLRYRRGGKYRRAWYGSSILLFLVAVASKQSVVVLPAILLAMDYFIERRKPIELWLDKLPYGFIAAFFALRTIGAQPATGHGIDLAVFGDSIGKSLWLLTGFGDQVLYRPRFDPSVQPVYPVICGFLAMLALVLAPVFRGRAHPLPLVLFCWIMLALIPPQLLGFIHPVTDRYLFFPSVGVVIFVACALGRISEQGGTGRKTAVAFVAVATIAYWAHASHVYVREWGDPIRLWRAATERSGDVETFAALGGRYQDAADSLDEHARGRAPVSDEVRWLAADLWATRPDYEALLAEWAKGARAGALTREFQRVVRELAWEQFERADAVRGTRVTPNLYFRRGKIQMDLGDLARARTEFDHALALARQHTFERARQELAVRCHFALGVIAWRERNYEEAMQFLQLAHQEQDQYKGNWVPDIAAHISRLQGILGRATSPGAGHTN